MQNDNNNNRTQPPDLDPKLYEKFIKLSALNQGFESLVFLKETSDHEKLKKETTLKTLLHDMGLEILRPKILFEIIKYDLRFPDKDLYLTSFKTITSLFGPDKFRTNSGKTLLMQACKYQKLNYIRHLMTLKPSPDLYAETKHGLSFLDYMPKLKGRMDILNIIFPPNETVYILDFWSNESMCPIFSDFENPNSGIVKGFEEDVKLGVLYICFKSYDLACMVRNYFNDREKEFMKQFNLSHTFVTVLNGTKATDDDKCFFDGFGKVEIVSFIKKSIGKKFGED